jgi:transketolase
MNHSYRDLLLAIGEVNGLVVVLDAGLGTSMQTEGFARAFPDRYFNLGIAEQNAVSVAAGLARQGFIPLVHTFSNFLSRRAHDQIALSVAWPGCHVKLVAGSCGLFDGRNGPSHTAIDDLSGICALPGMAVLEPGDMAQTESLLSWAVNTPGPCYLRLRRHGAPQNLLPEREHIPGTTLVHASNAPQCTLVACGSMLETVMRAAELLQDYGYALDLIHISRIRPLDAAPILHSIARSGRLFTIENHVSSGGASDLIAQAIGPAGVPHFRLALPDEFLPAGTPEWLLGYCRLDAACIAERIAAILSGDSYVSIYNSLPGRSETQPTR